MTVVLAGGRACGTTGAICTAEEKVLSGTLRLTVPGPASVAQVSIAAADGPVSEGADAVFTLTRTGAASAALTVAVAVSESGAMLDGEAPGEVTFEAHSATAALTLATADDEVAEAASAITATVGAGDGYTVAAEGASAEVTAQDDDAAPVTAPALAFAVPENTTAVATLVATDRDTPVESLAWSIVGGADAGSFALAEGGALALAAAKDFEAPDDADGDGTYAVTVRVSDGVNTAESALTASLTDVDEIAPRLAAASANGTSLTLTFSEMLDGDSAPGASAFAVTVAEASRTVDAVAVSGQRGGADARLGGGVGRDRDGGLHAAGGRRRQAAQGRGGQRRGRVHGPGGHERYAGAGEHGPDGASGDFRRAAGRGGADRVGVGDRGRRRPRQRDVRVAVAVERRDRGRRGRRDRGVRRRRPTRRRRTTSARPSRCGSPSATTRGNEETLVSAATVAVAATVPDAPGNPAAATSAGREAELTVTWTAPASDGGAAVTGYRVQWKSGSEDYDATASSTRQAAVTGALATRLPR